MRICGDNFAVASEQGLYISVWDWKSGEHISDFVCSFFLNETIFHYLTMSQMASLRSSVFTFLDEHHILFPSSIDDGLYVYDIRAMHPINMRKQNLKGTHCFEISVPQSWGHEAHHTIDLTCNSLAIGSGATMGPFYTNSHDRMISLWITVGLDPTGAPANLGRDCHEIHVRAHTLLMWAQAHPAPPNACVVVPWSAWSPAAARVVAPRVDDGALLYMCPPSQPKFSGCGMRIVSPPVWSDGTYIISVTDYHPARVFRAREQKVLTVNAESRNKPVVTHAEWDNTSTQDGGYSRGRSKSLPLPTVRAFSSLFTSPMYHPLLSNLVFWHAQPSRLVCDGSDNEPILPEMAWFPSGTGEDLYLVYYSSY
jgi:hypothetical protein